jgi:aminoglycoside 3-N-acetyltransferase
VTESTDDARAHHVERLGPFTVKGISADLRNLGLQSGQTVLVHSALSAFGYVVGGERTVVTALLDTLGPDGTLVVPTHSSDLSDPRHWSHPPIPQTWWETVRAEMPAYDPQLTGTRKMGAIPEFVRHLPGAQRSAHPTSSFCALGPNADFITANHALDNGFDDHSPLGRLYDLEASILLLGVGHLNNTVLHLAEGRAPAMRPVTTDGSPMMVNGVREWVTHQSLDYDARDFEQVGDAFAKSGSERVGLVGGAPSRLLAVVPLVDFATAWFTQHRTWRATSEE